MASEDCIFCKILQGEQPGSFVYRGEGCSAFLFLSDGSVAGQEVGHSHLHIVPRFSGDGQKVGFKHASRIANERLDAIASIIKENL